MINIIKNNTEIRMKKCFDAFKNYIKNTRTNQASPNLLNNIKIECYGTILPLKKLTNIVVENTQMLVITVFDHALAPIIKKTIMSSKLDLNPSLSNNIIRVPLPKLTEERRYNIIKIIRKQAEQTRIYIRNIRQDSNNKIKKLLKKKIISQNEDNNAHEYIQKLTNNYIKIIDQNLIQKEKEIIDI